MIKLTRTNYAGSSTSTLPDIKLIAEPSDINVVDPSETPGIPLRHDPRRATARLRRRTADHHADALPCRSTAGIY